MLLKNFMVSNPISVRPDSSLHYATQVMARTDTHYLPVTSSDNILVGFLSERDILSYRVRRPNHDPKTTPLSEAMQSRPMTATPENSLSEAAKRLAESPMSCLPVTEKGKLVGIVTRSGVLAAAVRSSMTAFSTHLTIADVMARDPMTVAPEDDVLAAAKLMNYTGVQHMPVVDQEEKVIGILSESGLKALVRRHEEYTRTMGSDDRVYRVGDAMSQPPLHVKADDNCGAVAGTFVQLGANAAVVTAEDGTIEGIVSYLDLLRSMCPGAAWPHDR